MDEHDRRNVCAKVNMLCYKNVIVEHLMSFDSKMFSSYFQEKTLWGRSIILRPSSIHKTCLFHGTYNMTMPFSNSGLLLSWRFYKQHSKVTFYEYLKEVQLYSVQNIVDSTWFAIPKWGKEHNICIGKTWPRCKSTLSDGWNAFKDNTWQKTAGDLQPLIISSSKLGKYNDDCKFRYFQSPIEE